MDIHNAASVGDLSAVRDAIKRGNDVNSVDEVGLFVGTGMYMYVRKAEAVKVCFAIKFTNLQCRLIPCYSLIPKYCLSTSQMRGKIVGHHTAIITYHKNKC